MDDNMVVVTRRRAPPPLPGVWEASSSAKTSAWTAYRTAL